MCRSKAGSRWGLIVLTAVLALYLFFLSQGITGGDAGEIVSAAVEARVAHPPGYPLYSFIGWLLARLPFAGTVAYRVGWLSAIPAALGVWLVFQIARRLGQDSIVALGVAASLGSSYLYWHYAEIQEVFALHLFFLLLTFYLVLVWLKKPQKKVLFLLSLLTGLELAHHHTYILVFPALGYVFMVNPESRIKRKFWTFQNLIVAFILFLTGAGFYLYVFFAGNTSPLFGWGPVTTIGEFLDLIARKAYGTWVMAKGASFSWTAGKGALYGLFYFLYHEFFPIGVIFIALGFFRLFRQSRVLFFSSLIWFLFTGVFFQLYASFSPRNWFSLATIERFYLLPYPAIAAWLALGMGEIKRVLTKAVSRIVKTDKKTAVLAAAGLIFLYPAWMFGQNYQKNDFRDFNEFEKYIKRQLASCPPGSVYLTRGDLNVFPLAYIWAVDWPRPDLKIINYNNPRPAVNYYPDFYSLKPLFENQKTTEGQFLAAFSNWLSQNSSTLCSQESLKLDREYQRYPVGLVFIYAKEKAAIDYPAVFEDNKEIWQSYNLVEGLVNNPRSEAYFVQNLVLAYYERALAISDYFFEIGYYQEARYWLNQAESLDIGQGNIARLYFIIDMKEGRCAKAKQGLERVTREWPEAYYRPAMEKLYENQCGEKSN